MTELQNVRTAEVVAAEIRALTASMLGNIIEIGRRMCEVKEMLPYGEFGKWIKENTGYSSSTANNFMRLFQEYGAAQGSLFGAEVESQTIGKLSYSKALALLALPAAERETFVEENNVADMSTRELQQALRERDAALRRAEEAEQAGEGSALALAELQEKLDEAQAKVRKLEQAEQSALDKYREADETADALLEELEALKSQPAAVVTQVDHEAVERARTEALEAANAVHRAQEKEADEAHKKALAALQQKLDKQDAALALAVKQRDEAKAEIDKAALARAEAERQAAALRDQLAAAGKKEQVSGNKDLVEFNVYFQTAQGELEKMGAVLGRLTESGQSELVAKLKNAMAALGKMAADLAETK